MTPIRDSVALAEFCARQRGAEFIAVDTEFMRERTYRPQLCLVQIAGPETAAAIDPLAEGIDLQPLYDLMADPATIKVFHAARQDFEIFYQMAEQVPHPFADTQVMAMVLGFGEAASYETLANKLAGAHIDKTQRFTNWSHRPLSDRQIEYAMSDVIPLRKVYERLHKKLAAAGRTEWVEDEMAILTDPKTYQVDPDGAWMRLRPRTNKPRYLAVLRAVAGWRESEADRRDLPRNRVLRDDTLLDIAAQAPTTAEALSRARGLPRGFAESSSGKALLAAIAEAEALPECECPYLAPRPVGANGSGPLVDLLKVLLKMRCETNEVAQKLIANSADLERIAANDDADVPALKGWRREIFGADAIALKKGALALAVIGHRIRTIDLAKQKDGVIRP
ncbi:MAG: ribonuclease D [Dongiaceae bacterium]